MDRLGHVSPPLTHLVVRHGNGADSKGSGELLLDRFKFVAVSLDHLDPMDTILELAHSEAIPTVLSIPNVKSVFHIIFIFDVVHRSPLPGKLEVDGSTLRNTSVIQRLVHDVLVLEILILPTPGMGASIGDSQVVCQIIIYTVGKSQPDGIDSAGHFENVIHVSLPSIRVRSCLPESAWQGPFPWRSVPFSDCQRHS